MASPVAAGINDVSNQALSELLNRLSSLDLGAMLVYLVDNVDASALPHLLDQFHIVGVEGALLAEVEGNRRELVKGSIAMHRKKGTPGSIKAAIRSAGFGEVTLYERPGDLNYDGVRSYNGLPYHGTGLGQWVWYHLLLSRPVTPDQVGLLRALCEEFAPARCKLVQIVYTEAACRYNADMTYDGTHTYGTT